MTHPQASQHETEPMRSDFIARPTPVRRHSKKRGIIITAAKDMFFKEGYAGASMDRITAQAAVSKATVYSHFRSKEELLLAVVEYVVVPIRDDYLSVLDNDVGFEDWLRKLAGVLAQKVLLPDVTALERLVIAEALRFPELGRIFQTIAIDSSLEVLRPRLEKAIADGAMRSCNTMIALEHFAEICAGPLRRRMLFNEGNVPTEAEIAQHVHEVVEMFLHGYGEPG